MTRNRHPDHTPRARQNAAQSEAHVQALVLRGETEILAEIARAENNGDGILASRATEALKRVRNPR